MALGDGQRLYTRIKGTHDWFPISSEEIGNQSCVPLILFDEASSLIF